MNKEDQEKNGPVYKVFEHGIAWSPSGFTEYSIYWSNGEVTKEKRICFPSVVEIRLKCMQICMQIEKWSL